jgi:hypothetical protein
MSAATVIEVRRPEAREIARVEVLDGEDLPSRYEQLAALVLRMGAWISGPQAQLLPEEQWEAQFSRYQELVEQLRELGDRLRPVCMRGRDEPLVGDALVQDVRELFAA